VALLDWQVVGSVDPTALVDARLELHYTAQLVASVGKTLLVPRPDDSHPNLGWNRASSCLEGRLVAGDPPLRVTLSFADLSIGVTDEAGSAQGEPIELAGRTLDETCARLETGLRGLGIMLPDSGLSAPGYSLPTHPLEIGARFSSGYRDERAELARWFGNGEVLLSALMRHAKSVSELRCWPHHFDLGGLSVVSTDTDGELAQSIGFGLSPGDESYPEPYWYVSPWPAPAPAALPGKLRWHTEGFTSAVLTGGEIACLSGTREQAEHVESFLERAVSACEQLLEAADPVRGQ
jgi:hypothetical protein